MRVQKGEPVFLWGDGTSVWTLTHADDFAPGFTGLIGNEKAIGDDFHITTDSYLTWEEIYHQIGVATGTTPQIFKLTPDQIKKAYPHWFWAEQIIGDLSHCAIFDNSKIKKISPRFNPTITWDEWAKRIAKWFESNSSQISVDEEINVICNRLFKIHEGINDYISHS
jgi:nucleoside-diphosphate-sugar epimerase